MPDLSKYTLLVVDDDADLRELMVSIFESQGFKVLSAENGNDAFEKVMGTQVDLVISDMRMPGGDGMSLLERVREFNPDIPVVIFVTGFTDISIAECLEKGARSVFPKPFDQKELVTSVKAALGVSV